MIHRLPITMTHNAPVNKIKPSTCRLSLIRILSQTVVQTKKETHRGALTFQIPFQGKIMGNGPRSLLEYERISKSTFFINFHLIRSPFSVKGKLEPKVQRNSPQHPSPNHLVFEWNEYPNFSIPLSPTVQDKRPQRLLYWKQSQHSQKGQLEWWIPTPLIRPKLYFIPHPYLKLNIFVENLPTHSDTTPQYWDVPRCYIGNFSIIRFPSERLGGSHLTSAMENFFEFIEELNLIDLPLEGGSYTWSSSSD